MLHEPAQPAELGRVRLFLFDPAKVRFEGVKACFEAGVGLGVVERRGDRRLRDRGFRHQATRQFVPLRRSYSLIAVMTASEAAAGSIAVTAIE